MTLQNLYKKLSEIDSQLPHGSNLQTKVGKALSSRGKNSDLLVKIGKEYLGLLKKVDEFETEEIPKWIDFVVDQFEDYYSFLRADENKKFSHQSDFLSSLIPEFLYKLYNRFVGVKYPDLELTTQKDIVIDLSFLPYSDNHLTFKPKRVDVAIIKKLDLEIGGKKLDFNITMVAIEVKTNLDKNMIGGVEYSVERLKKTFPLSKFFLISEFADFAYKKQNYASTPIDEIIILRKQKRSEVRRDKTKIRGLDKGLVESHITEILEYLESTLNSPDELNARMKEGRLIN
nr:Bpu10I family restriction endonuclease [uncultured Allomuricauda sp.]